MSCGSRTNQRQGSPRQSRFGDVNRTRLARRHALREALESVFGTCDCAHRFVRWLGPIIGRRHERREHRQRRKRARRRHERCRCERRRHHRRSHDSTRSRHGVRVYARGSRHRLPVRLPSEHELHRHLPRRRRLQIHLRDELDVLGDMHGRRLSPNVQWREVVLHVVSRDRKLRPRLHRRHLHVRVPRWKLHARLPRREYVSPHEVLRQLLGCMQPSPRLRVRRHGLFDHAVRIIRASGTSRSCMAQRRMVRRRT